MNLIRTYSSRIFLLKPVIQTSRTENRTLQEPKQTTDFFPLSLHSLCCPVFVPQIVFDAPLATPVTENLSTEHWDALTADPTLDFAVTTPNTVLKAPVVSVEGPLITNESKSKRS